MAPRTRIRHKDVRLILPQSPGVDKGEEKLAQGRYFEADCLSTDLVGDFVRITGADVAGIFQVSRVDISDSSTMPSIGVIIEKSTTTRCFVQTFGVMEATGLTPGLRYWVGPSGQIVEPKPVPVGLDQYVIQVVGVALSATALLLRPEMHAFKIRA